MVRSQALAHKAVTLERGGIGGARRRAGCQGAASIPGMKKLLLLIVLAALATLAAKKVRSV